MTPGNPLSLLSQPPSPKSRPTRREAVGKIGDWTVYEVKHGGMGDVYICGHKDSPPEAALKSFQPRLFLDPESRVAFLREISVWLRLTGTPFVMPAMGIEVYDGRLFVMMMAISEDERDVATIGDLIAKRPSSAVEIFTIAWQFAMGMQRAADAIPGVSHGDLTPSNLLYNGGPVFISDFGLASIGHASGTELRATPGYEAPEYPSTGPTPAADVYSYGVIISELVESYAHAAAPPIPTAPVGGILHKLERLAEDCRSRDPESRPSFDQIVKRLAPVVTTYPNELSDMFRRTFAFHEAFQEMRLGLLPQIARGLLKIDAPEQALNILDAFNDSELNNEAVVLKGTSLSLLGRDREALQWFERALQGPIDGSQKLSCLSEYALSLKRLGRLKDAEEIYEKLLAKAGDSQLGQVVVNLAGVYAEGQKHQKAVDILLRHIRSHQSEPLAFAALGNAYEALGQYEAAASQYQRALTLAPQLANIQVAFARICLRHLGRWEDADSALRIAQQQGFMSREWLVLALASSLLMRRKGDFDMLTDAAKRDLPRDEYERVEKDAAQITTAIIRRFIGPKEGEDNPQPSPQAPVELASQTTERGEPAELAPASNNTSASVTSSFEPAGLPFFNVRFYFPEHRFSFDYYDHLERPNYVEAFMEALNRFERDPSVNQGAELRSTPLYFHTCPNCGVNVLTNRDEGTNLLCRQCDVKAPTVKTDNERTRQVLVSVMRTMKKELKSYKGLTQYLIFQPVENNPELLAEMKKICGNAGFEEIDNSHIRAFGLAFARKAGVPFEEQREIVVVSRVGSSDEHAYAGQTPPESERLVRELRRLAPTRSCTTNLDPNRNDPASLFLRGDSEKVERQCREAVERSPSDVEQLNLLVQVLRINKKPKEAKLVALRATMVDPSDPGAWTGLAETESDLGDYAAAISHFEKAIELNPIEREALVGLYLCYKNLGDGENTEEIRSRIAALGGPELF